MEQMDSSSTDLLFAILRNMRQNVPPHVNEFCIGRCPTNIGHLLRRLLNGYGVRVRLFPRGKGNMGMRKGLSLGDSKECVVYVKGCTVKQLFVKLFRALLGVEWHDFALIPVCDQIVINDKHILISDAKGEVVRWNRDNWREWPHTVPGMVNVVRAAASGESARKLIFGPIKDEKKRK